MLLTYTHAVCTYKSGFKSLLPSLVPPLPISAHCMYMLCSNDTWFSITMTLVIVAVVSYIYTACKVCVCVCVHLHW